MTEDKREGRNLTLDEVKGILNRRQLDALLECQYFGWRLKFIRRPLFQEPVPVLYNDKFSLIGVLEQDGHINLDMELKVRSHKPGSGQTEQSQQIQETPDAAPWKEKRTGMAPVPDNLAELLNRNQMRVLRQIETFGWQLQFVRRPLFQDPVPVILSPRGDRYAILERDGRINMTHDLKVRSETSVEQAESTASASGPDIRIAE